MSYRDVTSDNGKIDVLLLMQAEYFLQQDNVKNIYTRKTSWTAPEQEIWYLNVSFPLQFYIYDMNKIHISRIVNNDTGIQARIQFPIAVRIKLVVRNK